MASEVTYKNLRTAVMEGDEDEVRKIMNEYTDIDLFRKSGDEDNLINVTIETADAEMLALLLGVRGPLYERLNTISDAKRHLINSVCDLEGNTPLLKAVQCGKVEMVSMLCLSGAEVNYCSQDGKSAIDLATDSKILILLFENDSKFPIDAKKSEELRKLISEDQELNDFFKKRDEVHESIKKGGMEGVKSLNSYLIMHDKRIKYFVNSKGNSLLYTAIENKKFDAWANLLLKWGLCYATGEEKRKEEGNVQMCERASSELLIPLEDCHLAKILSKCVIPPSVGPGMKIISEYLNYLNDFEITKTLMEVVQDIPGLQIAFDLESTSIERLRPCSSNEQRGIADFQLLKICVAAKRDEVHGIHVISSNLAHELCHSAMDVVFENNGLPYRKGDTEREGKYEEVMNNMKGSVGCQQITSQIWVNYTVGEYSRELIVRVPEMIALHGLSGSDVNNHLNEQEKALVSFYEKEVEPDLRKYIESSHTSGRILCRRLMDHVNLLSPVERIQVNEGIGDPIIGKHNHLHVLRASDIKLAQSHLKLFFKKEGKDDPFFCAWSLYEDIRTNTTSSPDGIKKCLITGEIKTLVLSWDIDASPKFCTKGGCTNFCPGKYYRDYTDCIYLLISTKWKVLNNIQSNNYKWDDLSPDTKKMIQEREVNIGGVSVKLKSLISDPEDGDYFENFMKKCVDENDISFLLGGGDIDLGKTNFFKDDQGYNMVLQHPEVFITRELTQNVVTFDVHMLRRFEKDAFFVSNVVIEDLCNLGISTSDIRQWNESSNNGTARCYVLHPLPSGKKEDSVFQEVLNHLRGSPDGRVKTLHHLKLRQGTFSHIKSISIHNEARHYLEKVEGLISQTPKRKLGDSDLAGSDPLLIADDAGAGKTTFLHALAKKIRNSHPKKWVSIVDLSQQSQQKHLATMEEKKPSTEEEILDRLFLMVGSGKNNSLEEKIFNYLCKKKNKIMVIFDAFDEICPNYKSVASSFMVDLRRINANIKMAVSTRLHERLDLEEAFGVISHQLIPFSEDDQITFLNDYWNELLSGLSPSVHQEKLERSIISFHGWVDEQLDDGISKLITSMEDILRKGKSMKTVGKLNFKPVARRILLDQESVFNVLDKLTELPLHVQMVATVIFEDSFQMSRIANLGHLYQLFFDMKIKLYNQEKGHSSGNVQSQEATRMIQKAITKMLEDLSAKLLWEEYSCEITDDDRRCVCNVGLVSRMGEDYQFIHRTFAEFFFARKILGEADRSVVTKLWLNRLFNKEQFANVRRFMEDMLYLLSGGSINSKRPEDFLMLKKAYLDQSVLEYPIDLIYPMYSIVEECSVHTLQYFADSFGKKIAQVLIEEASSVVLCSRAIVDPMSRSWMKDYNDKEIIIFDNLFIFAASCFSDVRVSTRYANLVRKMFDIFKQYKMLDVIKKLLQVNRVKSFIPMTPVHYESSAGSMMYVKEVLIFLLEHKEIFRYVFREWMDIYSKQCTGMSFLRILTTNFDLLLLVVNALYNETQLKSMLTENGFISGFWISVTGKYSLRKTEHVWNFIKDGLETDVTNLRNYLLWKDVYNFNSLFSSAYNENPEVIEFIWDLAGQLMNDHEKKKWLLNSFDCGVCLTSSTMYLGWSFHKFLVKLINSSFLSGDEMVSLLKSKDTRGKRYILQGYPYGLFSHLLPISHCINIWPLVEKMRNLRFFRPLKCWLDHNSNLPLNKELMDEVDSIFEEVKSHDKYKLTDHLQVVESGHLVDIEFLEKKIHQDRFKFFVVAFFKHVEFFRDSFKEDGLFKCLKAPIAHTPNILCMVIHFLPILCLGYVSSVLIDCLPRGHFLALLLEPYTMRNFCEDTESYVDNPKVQGKCKVNLFFDYEYTKKLHQVIRAIYGENCVSIMYSGLYYSHFHGMNMNHWERGLELQNIIGIKKDVKEDEIQLVLIRLLFQENVEIDGIEDKGPLTSSIKRVWIDTAGRLGIGGIRQVWDVIEGSLRGIPNQLQDYLLWKEDHRFNSLSSSAYNEDTEVIEFIWELSGELMNDHEKKKWLFDSFDCELCPRSDTLYLGWSFHKFLVRLINSGFLSEDEMFRLLKSKDYRGEYYILRGYPFGLFSHLLPIDHHIGMRPLLEEMHNLSFFHHLKSWLDHNSFLPLNKEVMDEVDSIFEEVKSHDKYELTDQLQVDESGHLVGVWFLRGKIHQDRLKFFVAAFFKQVHFCKYLVEEGGLVKCFQLSPLFHSQNQNILHMLVASMPTLCLGYASSILMESLSTNDFLDLLFQPNGGGWTVFKIAYMNSDRHCVAEWNKLNDVVGALLGKDAGVTNPNETFRRHNKPKSLVDLKEILAEWRRIWTLQKARYNSVS